MGGMERRTEEWTVGNGWMEWSGERMNGRMESMFDSGMDGCLGEKRRKVSILGGFFGGVSERTKKNLKKLGKVRKKLAKVSLHLRFGVCQVVYKCILTFINFLKLFANFF